MKITVQEQVTIFYLTIRVLYYFIAFSYVSVSRNDVIQDQKRCKDANIVVKNIVQSKKKYDLNQLDKCIKGIKKFQNGLRWVNSNSVSDTQALGEIRVIFHIHILFCIKGLKNGPTVCGCVFLRANQSGRQRFFKGRATTRTTIRMKPSKQV